MQHRFRPAFQALSAAFLGLAAACAQVPDKVSGGTEDGTDKVPAASAGIAGVKKGRSPRRQAVPVLASPDEARALVANNPAVKAFLEGEGKGWTVSFDRRSGLPMYFEGPGIAWVPGRGNSLTAQQVFGGNYLALPAGSQAKMLAAQAESQARALVKRNAGLLGIEGGALTPDDSWTGSQDAEATLYLATFRHAPGGAEQHDARLTFVINDGNLIQVHAERLLPALKDSTAKIDSDAAFAHLRRLAGVPADATLLSSDLKVVALADGTEAAGIYSGPVGAGYEQHLAFVFRFTVPNDTRTLAAMVDAQSGQLLDLWDDNRYGHVEGAIYPRTSTQQETTVPFPLSTVGSQRTDLGGNFTGTTGTSSLNGGFIALSDSCGAPAGTASSGTIAFSSSTGTDCSFGSTGHSTRSARNAYYHLNIVRQMANKWLGGGVNAGATSWFASNVTANVNVPDVCNAFWNGSSVNFFRSGSGCANTGEIADVMQHEYGHGIDSSTKSGSTGDFAKGEAVADTVALLLSHDKCVGPGFLPGGGGETAGCSTAVRDFTLSVTLSNIGSKCSKSAVCAGALGFECHCESHLLSGATWDLSQAYLARYGATEGWHQFERTYLRALPMITAYLANSAGNAYSAFLAADDDNGSTADGTPNADLINAAFAAHGLANTTRPPVKVVGCPNRPGAPSLSATGGSGNVALSWTAVSGATNYTIYRNLSGHAPAFLPVGSARGTSFTDVQVQPGFTYNYVISATAGACTTALGTPVSATPAQPTTTNDFSVTLSPLSSALTPGSSASVIVTTGIASGSAQGIGLAISGLPSGVTGAFNPGSVTAGGTSTLTLTASASAAAATASYTVTGTAASGSHSANGSLTVTSTTPPPGSITNGGFESGLAGWSTAGSVAARTNDAHGGAGSAQVGSTSPNNGNSTLAQTFTVPGGGVARLSLWYKPFNPGNDTLTYSQMQGQLRDSSGATVVTLFNLISNSQTWTQITADLSAYQGKALTLWLNSHDDGYPTDPNWFLVDDVTLTVAAPDTTAPVATVTAPAAGATVSGTATVSASATDNVGVTRIELYVDGALLGSGTSSPASASWNTTTAADGVHSITAKAYDAAGNAGTSGARSVTVHNAVAPHELIGNGGFESGLGGWVLNGSQTPYNSLLYAHGGAASLRMGWVTGNAPPAGDSFAYQAVTIPANATKATLGFWYYAFTEDSIAYDWQEARIRNSSGITQQVLMKIDGNAQTWTQRTFDVTAYKGQTIQVLFNAHSDGDFHRTTLWVDDVSLVVQ